jgi:tRNA pseudouridine55 synthase
MQGVPDARYSGAGRYLRQKYGLTTETWQRPYAEGRVLLIDKPLRWTSFDVVKKVRIATRVSKVGHAGTLDPLATGLLILCTGRMTKEISGYMAQEKEYEATFTLGSVTPTYDLESQPEDPKPVEGLTETIIRETAALFTGEQLQVPPAHSAVKRAGRPAYLDARKGREVVLEPRRIHIRELEVVRIDMPRVEVRVVCTTGTYIRSLANDFGLRLGCGAHLSALRRTRIGDFHVSDALTVEAFMARLEQERNGGQNG